MNTKCIDCDGTGEIQEKGPTLADADVIETCDRCGGTGDEPEEG